MDELKQLFKELLMIVQQYGDSSYNVQKGILKEILNIIEDDDTDIDKISQIKHEYYNLFFLKVHCQSFIFGEMTLMKGKS